MVHVYHFNGRIWSLQALCNLSSSSPWFALCFWSIQMHGVPTARKAYPLNMDILVYFSHSHNGCTLRSWNWPAIEITLLSFLSLTFASIKRLCNKRTKKLTQYYSYTHMHMCVCVGVHPPTFLKASVSIWVEMGDHFQRGLLRLPSTLGLSSTAFKLPSALWSSTCECVCVCVMGRERQTMI